MSKLLLNVGVLAVTMSSTVMMAIGSHSEPLHAAPATSTAQTPAPVPAPPVPTAPSSATPPRSGGVLYNPVPLTSNNEITDTLTDKDIPTGSGGFARDYLVNLKEGDQVVVDLSSDQFDTILLLIGPDGATVGENDDGPDGTTNSLLFARITRGGNYVVRVSPYAGQGTGSFKLKVTRLRPAG